MEQPVSDIASLHKHTLRYSPVGKKRQRDTPPALDTAGSNAPQHSQNRDYPKTH